MDPVIVFGFASELKKIASGHVDLIPGGLADKKQPKDFPAAALAKGKKTESEHTSSKGIATEIAMDHLMEDPYYYSKLEKMEKGAGISLKDIGKPFQDTGLGSRGIVHDKQIHVEGMEDPVGEVSYKVHPEGHAEVNSFFIDPDHQGKGYGQAALKHILDTHGAIISDTRTGTTGMAQRAMHKLISKIPDVEAKDLHATDVGGRHYTDMDDNKTSIWYVKKKGGPSLTDDQLKDIENNSKYHRRRTSRAAKGTLAGMLVGGMASNVVLDRAQQAGHLHSRVGNAFGNSMMPRAIGAIAGGIGGYKAVNRAQYEWDKRKNLKGDW